MSRDVPAAVAGLDPDAMRSVDADRAAATREHLISGEEAAELAESFKLLAEASRLRILYALLEAGEMCVCDLAATVGVSETSVSHTMRLFRGARIVRRRRSSRMIYYRLDDAHVKMVLDVSRDHLDHGRGSGS